MSRYIDADALANKLTDWSTGTVEPIDWSDIAVAPSIDIVRCEECKFSESVITSWSTDGKNNVVERLCKVHKWSVKDDDFCSYGEREGE